LISEPFDIDSVALLPEIVNDPGKKHHLQQDNGVHAMRVSPFSVGDFFCLDPLEASGCEPSSRGVNAMLGLSNLILKE
jgi:hypothetical protein